MKVPFINVFFFFSLSILGQKTIEINDQTKLDLLNEHNKERKLVNVPNLRWSDTLAEYAQEWAMHLAKVDDIFHREDRDGFGENISYFYDEDLRVGVQLWNDEKALYKHQPIGGKGWEEVGHYTQVVWKWTSEVGCGCAQSKSGAYYLVCNYNPAGNLSGSKPY